MKRIILMVCSLEIFLSTFAGKPAASPGIPETTDQLVITILYDNYVHNKELGSGWGFSCLIEGMDKTILFDTGNDDGVMLSNMARLQKSPEDVDIVVLSHIHADHTGGLMDFLERNNSVTVYLPASFPDRFKNDVEQAGAELIEVSDPVEIIQGVSSTGEMGSGIIEQSLIIETGKGIIVVTGCAHPGIDRIVHRAAELRGEDIFLVMGGFHLLRTAAGKVRSIADDFHDMGVKYAAPTHCSGDQAIEAFRVAYGDHCLRLGVGRIIHLNGLEQ